MYRLNAVSDSNTITCQCGYVFATLSVNQIHTHGILNIDKRGNDLFLICTQCQSLNPISEELRHLRLLLAKIDNVAVLENALTRCRDEDMQTTEVDAALSFLEQLAQYKLPFKRFREALLTENSESRWQIMHSVLAGIMLVLGLF